MPHGELTPGLLLFILVVGVVWFFAENAPVLGVILLLCIVVWIFVLAIGGGKKR